MRRSSLCAVTEQTTTVPTLPAACMKRIKRRCSSVGQSTRFIPVASLVQIQSPLPLDLPRPPGAFILLKSNRHHP